MIVFLLAIGSVLAADVVPRPRAHAHNDYEHPRPLLDALDHGFCSVEADIWLSTDGRSLLVAHTPFGIKPERTLQKLYLDPLKERIGKNRGRVHPNGPDFHLMIDIKTNAKASTAKLLEVLADYSDILTSTTGEKTTRGAVTIVVSGNCDRTTIREAKVRLAGIDGRPSDLDSDEPTSLVPWISSDWKSQFQWNGTGAMPANERAKLKDYVAAAHKRGRKVRFWAAPDHPAAWQELVDAEVDLINTDKIKELSEFLGSPRK